MNRSILLIIVFCIFTHVARAQANDNKIDSGWGNLDYSVPESPAFKLLGKDPTTILRPTSVREIAVTLGNNFSSGQGLIPENFAASVSPLLISKNLNLKKYNENKFWYRSSLSLGTNSNEDKSTNLSLGFHFTFVDKTDIRADETLKAKFLRFAAQSRKINEAARDSLDAEETGLKLSEINDALDDPANPHHARLKKRYDEILDELRPEKMENRVAELRKNFKDASWNKAIVQAGIAGLFRSESGPLNEVTGLSKTGLWVSAGLPSGKSGQWLLGLQVAGINLDGDASSVWNSSLACRYYYGKNTTKIFAEGEGKLNDMNSGQFAYSASLGGEVNLLNGFWIDFSFGITKPRDGEATFTPSVNLKMASPERK